MKKFAFVTDDGQVAYIMSTGTTSDYCDNTRYGDYTAFLIDGDVDNHTFISTQYWDGNVWQVREPKPSDYHEWVNYKWQFDQALFTQVLRTTRNKYLSECDWTQIPDSPLNEEQKGAWATYRQELRDLPENCSGITSLDDVVWPTPPN